MAIKIIKADSRAWRPYRFPPRCATASADSHGWDSDPAARQRAISEGFQAVSYTHLTLPTIYSV